MLEFLYIGTSKHYSIIFFHFQFHRFYFKETFKKIILCSTRHKTPCTSIIIMIYCDVVGYCSSMKSESHLEDL